MTTEPAHEHDPLQPPATTLWRALGEVASIFATSPAYKFFTLADLEWLVAPPLQANQCRLAHKGKQPVGVVLWARLDEATASHMLDPRFRLRPDQWTCGDQIWVTDIVHTGGPDPALTNAMLLDARGVIGMDVAVHVRPVEVIAALRAAAANQAAATPPPSDQS